MRMEIQQWLEIAKFGQELVEMTAELINSEELMHSRRDYNYQKHTISFLKTNWSSCLVHLHFYHLSLSVKALGMLGFIIVFMKISKLQLICIETPL